MKLLIDIPDYMVKTLLNDPNSKETIEQTIVNCVGGILPV